MLRRTLLALPTPLTLLLGLALPAEAQPRCETTVTIGKVRVCNARGEYEPAPRAPRAWQPTSPRPLQPTRTTRSEERWPAPGELPVAEALPSTQAPRAPLDRGPAAWRQATAPRVVPLAWREALPPHALLDAHRRVREATDVTTRCAVIDEVARTWAVTVDQVICLAAALPPAERLGALTRLHAGTTDASAYGRTYGLLGEEERLVLHVRITRPFDAETAAQRARLERLRHEERQLQRVLGD